ncbi:MAG: hypothetical protein ABJF88_06715 [Rhodothermales bacterium]
MDWTVIGAMISAIAALGATIFAFLSTQNSRRQSEILEKQMDLDRRFRKMEVHARLISQGRDIQSRLPAAVGRDSWIPSEEDRRQITMFWYHIFDEWTICKEEESELHTLWDEYYSKGVASALKIPAFRDNLKELLKASNLFGKADRFHQEIDRIHKGAFGHHLWQEA